MGIHVIIKNKTIYDVIYILVEYKAKERQSNNKTIKKGSS